MNTIDELYKEMTREFKEQNTSINEIKDSIRDLCTRTTINEKDINSIVSSKIRTSEHKHWIITTLFGGVATAATIISVWTRFFS